MNNLIVDTQQRNFVAGVKQVTRGLSEGAIKKIYLACDSEQQFKNTVLTNASHCKVEVEICGSRSEFATLCKLDVLCAVIGILID